MRESELYQQFFSQSVPDLLAKAKQSEIPAERAQIYGQAAYILVSQRKFDEAIELLPHLVESGGEKGSAGDLVYGSAAMAALEKGELERAAKYFKNVTDPDQRTRGFIHLAQTALKQRKTPQAKKFLDEAKQTLKHINVEWAQMHSTVEIANVEAKLDAGRGFQSIEAAGAMGMFPAWGPMESLYA